MAIPNLPPFYDFPYTDKDGKLTTQASFHNDQSFQTHSQMLLLNNAIATTQVSTNQVIVHGINPPIKTTAEITALIPAVPIGTIWFNSTLKKLQVKTDTAAIETITSVTP